MNLINRFMNRYFWLIVIIPAIFKVFVDSFELKPQFLMIVSDCLLLINRVNIIIIMLLILMQIFNMRNTKIPIHNRMRSNE